MSKVAPKRRRLSDLYVVGKTVVFEDPEGDVEIYLRRPNPFEHEEALREGNLARAKMALRMKDPASDEYQILQGDLTSLGDAPQKAELLFTENIADFYQRASAWVAEQPKWADSDYITSLTDSMAEWEEKETPPIDGDDDYEDYQRVKAELAEFDKAADSRLEVLKEEQLAEYCALDPAELDEKIAKIFIDRHSGVAFYRGYRIACLFFATRDPDDPTKRYFNHKQEVAELPAEVQTKLLEEYDSLDLPRDAVKNSPSAEDSSVPSAPSPSPETSEPSGLEVATA